MPPRPGSLAQHAEQLLPSHIGRRQPVEEGGDFRGGRSAATRYDRLDFGAGLLEPVAIGRASRDDEMTAMGRS